MNVADFADALASMFTTREALKAYVAMRVSDFGTVMDAHREAATVRTALKS